MKRSVAILAVLLVVAIAYPAVARPENRKRTETREYVLPEAVGASTDIPALQTGGVDFDPRSATSVTIAVKDDHAPATIVELRQNGDSLGVFCTRTMKRVRIDPNATLRVLLFAGTCDGSAAFATTGVVRATFASK